MRARRAIVALALGLAACHGKQDDAGRSAAAEVLPGSASDAMIAYDTLKSQPPLAVPSEEARDRDRGGGGTPAADADAPTPSVAAPDTASSEPVSAPSVTP